MPKVRYFKPRGIPLVELTEVYLTIEGAEALRLVDAEGRDLNTAALQTNVSHHTLIQNPEAEPAAGIRFPRFRFGEAGTTQSCMKSPAERSYFMQFR